MSIAITRGADGFFECRTDALKCARWSTADVARYKIADKESIAPIVIDSQLGRIGRNRLFKRAGTYRG
jgi:hypothetical protein